VPRAELLQSLWGYSSGSFTRTVDTHIASLRQKLEVNPGRPEAILTTPGVGYKFVGTIQK
jgi:DNA-binding response OmpR family regulator